MTVAIARPVAPLFDNLPGIESHVKDADRIALFLDFDGTVSRIVPTPSEAEIDPQVRPVLERLVARSDFDVAIVSGRAVSDVRQRARLGNVIYVGNHGFEIEAGETRFREPKAEALRRELKCLSLQLQLALGEIEGAAVEDKGLTLSVHFRCVSEELQGWVEKTAWEVVSRSKSFIARPGKKVVDVRPELAWHKGHAVQWICREVLHGSTLPIYIGDDATDEDAFAAIPHGITIKVGGTSATEAQYQVSGVSEVGRFLDWLDHAKPHESLANAQRVGG